MGANELHHHPMDDITVRTPCEVLYQQKKRLNWSHTVLLKYPSKGGTIHGMQIPEGYGRVMVDRVERGWEDRDLEIPGDDGEEELG